MGKIKGIYKNGVIYPSEKLNLPNGSEVYIEVPRKELIKKYRGIFGKVSSKMLKEFEMEAEEP